MNMITASAAAQSAMALPLDHDAETAACENGGGKLDHGSGGIVLLRAA